MHSMSMEGLPVPRIQSKGVKVIVMKIQRFFWNLLVIQPFVYLCCDIISSLAKSQKIRAEKDLRVHLHSTSEATETRDGVAGPRSYSYLQAEASVTSRAPDLSTACAQFVWKLRRASSKSGATTPSHFSGDALCVLCSLRGRNCLDTLQGQGEQPALLPPSPPPF